MEKAERLKKLIMGASKKKEAKKIIRDKSE